MLRRWPASLQIRLGSGNPHRTNASSRQPQAAAARACLVQPKRGSRGSFRLRKRASEDSKTSQPKTPPSQICPSIVPALATKLKMRTTHIFKTNSHHTFGIRREVTKAPSAKEERGKLGYRGYRQSFAFSRASFSAMNARISSDMFRSFNHCSLYNVTGKRPIP